MKLVNTYKHIFNIILLFMVNNMTAQEAWTLKQCLDSAQAHNKQLQIYRNNIAISQQKEKEATANLVPKLSANADYKYFAELPHQLMPLNTFNPKAQEWQFKDVQFGVSHNINIGLQLVIPLYNTQIYSGIQQTKTAKELAELQLQKTEEQVVIDITTLYYNAQIIKKQLLFIDSNILNTYRLLQTVQLLHKQQMAKISDVTKVNLQAEQLQAQKEQLQYKYMQILNALKLSIGISYTRNIIASDEIVFTQKEDSKIKNNIDYQLIQTQQKIIHIELHSLSYSRFIPSFNLIGSYGATGFGYDKKPNNFLKFYPVSFAGLQLNYTLFNGTITQRKINQKKLELKNNELQTQIVLEKNEIEIINTSNQKKIALLMIYHAEKQITQAQAIYEQVVLQQKQEVASLTDVLLADNTLRETQQNYLAAIIDYLKADLELKKLTGTIKN